MTARRRILLVQPSIQPPGGGNSVAVWMIEALKRDHDVTVCTLAPVDLDAVNRFYGTAIGASEVRLVRAPSALARLVGVVPLPLALLKAALLWRTAVRVAAGFDIVISSNNEADFGRPGIQYIHYPWNLRPRPTVDLRWYHLGPLLRAYYGLCDTLAAFSPEGARLNLTLVNSDWTGALVTRRYGIATQTLHPPVVTEFPDVPWNARDDGFVCIGRISPEKELDRVIDVLAAVRRRAPGVSLHIVGTPGERRYYRRILRRARAHADWITVHENLSRADLARLVAGRRYGIHGMLEEHFGIAIAEMVCAGCIPFLPAGGGQVEIVGGDDRFLYRSVDDAVAKILSTLGDPAEQARRRADLATRRERFSAGRFMSRVRDIVAGFPPAVRDRTPLTARPGPSLESPGATPAAPRTIPPP